MIVLNLEINAYNYCYLQKMTCIQSHLDSFYFFLKI